MKPIDEKTLSQAQQDMAARQRGILKARAAMAERFAKPNWHFAVGTPDDREQRNACSYDAGLAVVNPFLRVTP